MPDIIDDTLLSIPKQPLHSTTRHRLAGVVTVDGQPATRLVCVFDRLTMVLLAATWSHPTTGAWEFKGLPEYPFRRFFVVALDNTGNFNAEIIDYITQVNNAGEAPVVLNYEYCYPPNFNSVHVQATSFYSTNYYPYFACDPALSLTGSGINTTWVSLDGGNANQKFNIDFGVQKIIKRLHLENGHWNGGTTEAGIRNFSVYGTNSATAFVNITYANIDDLTLLGTFEANRHVSQDVADPQYFLLNNNVAYRYVVLRIADCHGHISRMGVKRIAFQIVV